MQRLSSLLLLSAAATVGWPLAVLAAPPADREPAALFKDLDKNEDGQISDDEVPDESRKLHKRLLRLADADKNGQLSLDEFSAGLSDDSPGAEAPSDGQPERPARRPGGNQERRKRFEQMREQLWEMDANSDGKIVSDEVPDQFRPRFESILDRLDTDGDDALSKEEIAAGDKAMGERFRRDRPEGPPGPDGKKGRPEGPDGPPGVGPNGKGRPGRGPAEMIERLKEADANGDGKIELNEVPDQFKQGFERILDHLDNDGDDALSPEEIKGASEFAQRMQGGPGGGGPGRFGGPGGPPGGLGAIWERLKKADKDGDGKLSKEELPEPMQARFAQLDANNDGYVEQEELKQAGERMRKQMQKRAKKAGKGKSGKPQARKSPGNPKRPGGKPNGPPPVGEGPPANSTL